MQTEYRYRQPEINSRSSVSHSDTFFEGNIDARDGVKLTHCGGQNVNSSSGHVIASDSLFKKITARDGIILSDVFASNVKTSSGRVEWENATQIPNVRSIDARDGVTLKNVIAEDVSCSSGSIKWSNSAKEGEISSIEARDGAVIENLNCIGNISVSSGKIEAINSNANSISARDGIRLQETSAKTVRCASGTIIAQNCKLQDISARDGCTLTNSIVRSVTCSSGAVSKKSEALQTSLLIEARDEINLLNQIVEGKVKAISGAVVAENCDLQAVECRSKIILTNSKAKDVSIAVTSNHLATIVLNKGTIHGDVIITACQSSSSNVSSNIGRSFGGGISVGASEDGFEIHVGNLSMLSYCGVSDGVGTVNGKPYQCVNGRFIPIDAKAAEKKKIQVIIEGEGIITGNIIFDKCEGIVTATDDQVKGSVQQR